MWFVMNLPRRGEAIRPRNAPYVVPNNDIAQRLVVPKRWIVGRTHAWLGHFRRLAKDFEILRDAAKPMIHIAMLRLNIIKHL